MSFVIDEIKRLNLLKPYNRRLWCRRLGIPVSLHGVKLLSHRIQSNVVLTSILKGSYEADEASSLQGWLRTEDRVLELGTGFGFVTCLAAKAVKSGEVLSFEANPHMVQLARETLELNNVTNVEVRQGIVGDTSGEITFYLSPHFWESSLTPNPNWDQISVPTLNLEEVLTSFQPTAVIMDIEGGEYDLLKLNAWNEASSVQKLSIEFHRKTGATKALQALTLFSANWECDTSINLLANRLEEEHVTVTFVRAKKK